MVVNYWVMLQAGLMGGRAVDVGVKRLDCEWDRPAKDLLARCFETDPAVTLFAGASRRRRQNLFGVVIRLHRDMGQPMLGIVDHGRLVGVALIQEPGARPSTTARIRALLGMILFVHPAAYSRQRRQTRSSAPVPDVGPRHTLHLMGVDPKWRGQGLARMMLEQVHAMALDHPRSHGVTLETVSGDTVSLYRRFGYRLVASLAAPAYNSYHMVRDHLD